MSANYLLTRLNIFKNTSYLFNNLKLQSRNSSYQNSKPVGNIDQYTSKFEVTRSEKDWKFVERILPPAIVPKPASKTNYASGWKPQTESCVNEKYFIERTKNHMIPVYLTTSHRGMRKITKIRRIQGDVFALEKDVKSHLERTLQKDVATQVNELVGYVHIKGDHVRLVKEYLLSKGF